MFGRAALVWLLRGQDQDWPADRVDNAVGGAPEGEPLDEPCTAGCERNESGVELLRGVGDCEGGGHHGRERLFSRLGHVWFHRGTVAHGGGVSPGGGDSTLRAGLGRAFVGRGRAPRGAPLRGQYTPEG